jgi:chloramphenicol-sensitive protein RarD
MTHERNDFGSWAAGIGAYVVWGAMPLFWRMFEGTQAMHVFIHRCLWAFPFLVLLSRITKRQSGQVLALDRGRWPWLIISGLLIGTNWWLYIVGVGQHQVVQMSLGYFFAPLMTAAFGVVFLREKLTYGQWFGVLLVLIGVGLYSWNLGHLPMLAVGLATTFSGYSLVKKMIKAPPMSALTTEAGVLFILACFYLATSREDQSFAQAWQDHSWKLVLGGTLTALPLLWFAHAMRGLTLTSLGMLNYISPTGKLLIAIFVFGEVVTAQDLWAFGVLWAGIIVYLAFTYKHSRMPLQPE